MLGFIRWLFKGTLKNVQFYACMITVLGLVARVGGCPGNIPFAIVLTGLIISAADLIWSMISYQYLVYTQEKERVLRELARK